jgi:predicted nucleotide-binding protein (sugar kinase/HSP70/actin superfamily)
MSTIGIPRALHYYKYYPLWRAFFEELGFDVITSGTTNRSCLENGSLRLVSDTCVPVKAYIGHVITLVDKCDMIFSPVIRSLEKKVYNCSRFLGLPDLVKAVVPEAKNILEVDIDVNRGINDLNKQIVRAARKLDITEKQLRRAAEKAKRTYTRYLGIMRKFGLTYPQAIDYLDQKGNYDIPHNGHSRLEIGLIGHPYVLHDEYINHDLIQRIKNFNVKIYTPEMLSQKTLRKGIKDIAGYSYWTSESDVLGATGAYLDYKIDGIIGATAFSCGPDSLMMNLAERAARSRDMTPFLCLTIEEHSSDTGLITRLEAFLDMIIRRKRTVNI